MNALQLQATLSQEINKSVNARELTPHQAIAVLEIVKMDVYEALKKLTAEQPAIIPASQILPR
jgi:hypothetical protein